MGVDDGSTYRVFEMGAFENRYAVIYHKNLNFPMKIDNFTITFKMNGFEILGRVDPKLNMDKGEDHLVIFRPTQDSRTLGFSYQN